MKIKGNFLTTGIGSLPYLDAEASASKVCAEFEIPFWPQLPKKGFKENMYVQFSQGLPFLIIDEKNRKIFIDSSKDLSEGLGRIYEVYLSKDYNPLAVTKDFAEGFYAFLKVAKKDNARYVKGHITGPVSFGLGIVDEKGRAIIYNDTLRDGLVKLLEIKAAWQIAKLKDISEKVIIFIDEPYLTGFGSSFFNIQRHDILEMLNALIKKIHSKGALTGVHCCGNTDWSIFTDTQVDIINFDAYSYADGLFLYSKDISGFLKRGGYLAWGIVPTSEDALKETEKSLFNRLFSGIALLEKKSIPRDLLISNSLLTPSCGMGTLSENLTQDIVEKLSGTARLAKERL